MPMSYCVDASTRMLIVAAEGAVTQDERLSTMRRWLSDPAYEPGMSTLCDFSASTSTPTLKELQEIVAFIGRHADLIGKKKLAVVAARTLTFGVARQFQALTDSGPLEVKVFTTRSDAVEWLQGGHEQYESV
jgi:hypothetical protein